MVLQQAEEVDGAVANFTCVARYQQLRTRANVRGVGICTRVHIGESGVKRTTGAK